MKTIAPLILAGWAACCLSPVFSYGQHGSPDNTFDSDGKVVTSVYYNDYGYSTVIQSDGKIVVAGFGQNGSNPDFAVVRYNSDGSLDNTFDSDGKLLTPVGSSNDYGTSAVIQADGKIVVAGYIYLSASAIGLVRYNTDGSLDNTFGLGGKVVTAIGNNGDQGLAVALQEDGKILVAGYSYSTTADFVLVRYNTDGSLDSMFGSDGIVITAFGSGDDYGYSVAVQKDGRIVIGGTGHNGTMPVFALARYNSDGSLDNTFDTDGKVTTAIGTVNDKATSIAIQSDGKIVAAGINGRSNDGDFGLVRYNSDGSLDNTFGTGGKVTTDFGQSAWLGLGNISVQILENGKIIVAGNTGIIADIDFALACYNSDGSLDSTFGSDGKVTTDFGTTRDYCQSAAIQADGRIVMAGYRIINTGGIIGEIAVARYNVCPPVNFSQTLTLNQGDSVVVGTSIYKVNGIYKDTFTAANGCDSIVTSNLTFLTAIEEGNSRQLTVRVFPNPLKNFTTMEILDPRFTKGDLIIYDLVGQEVYRREITSGRGEITLNLDPGIYLYKLSGGNELVGSGKLVVQ